MFLKTRMLNNTQQSVLRKAILLYISSLHKRHHNGQINDITLSETLNEVNLITDLLHLKQD
jgi:hypothetical protein